MDKKQFNQIKRKLREVWMISPERSAAVTYAKEKVHTTYFKNGNKKFKVMYRCTTCTRLVNKGDYNIDHTIPVEPSKDWNEYIEKLFCSTDNLSLLCCECHAAKTAEER